MKKNLPPAVAKSIDENATSRAPRAGTLNYKAQAKGKPNVRGLPNFMHGKKAGRSMILAQQ